MQLPFNFVGQTAPKEESENNFHSCPSLYLATNGLGIKRDICIEISLANDKTSQKKSFSFVAWETISPQCMNLGREKKLLLFPLFFVGNNVPGIMLWLTWVS